MMCLGQASATADKLQKECCEQGIDQQTCLNMPVSSPNFRNLLP